MGVGRPVRTSIVVISLSDAADRRAVFTARAAKTALPWRWFDARRELGPELEHDPDEAIVSKGRPMYPGELGFVPRTPLREGLRRTLDSYRSLGWV